MPPAMRIPHAPKFLREDAGDSLAIKEQQDGNFKRIMPDTQRLESTDQAANTIRSQDYVPSGRSIGSFSKSNRRYHHL